MFINLNLLHSSIPCFKSNLSFVISFSIASLQKVVLVSLSICSASSTVFGMHIPNLCVVFQYLLLIFDITLLHFLRMCLTHHENSGSSSLPLCTVYSATLIGFDAFISLSGIHKHDSFFYLINRFQSLVVFLGILFPL